MWTRDRQMSMAGKRYGFERDDFFGIARSCGLKKTSFRRRVCLG